MVAFPRLREPAARRGNGAEEALARIVHLLGTMWSYLRGNL